MLAVFTPATNLHAAEVACLEQYGAIAADLATAEDSRKIWPSGYRPRPESCNKILIRGEITKGDYQRFKTLYSQHHRAVFLIYLVSQGGDVQEAVAIGRLLRKYPVSVDAPSRRLGLDNDAAPFELKIPPHRTVCEGSTCICASACSLIWFGAVRRSGTVGLHRPRITDPEFAALAPAEASSVYRRALKDISTYLEEMEVPRPLIDVMTATSSAEIRWVNDTDNKLEHPPSYVEWVDASCGPFTSREAETLDQLRYRKAIADFSAKGAGRPGDRAPLTANETMLYKMLGDKDWKRRSCMNDLTRVRLDSLPPP